MDRFYIPFNYKIENVPIIIYPAKDENSLKNIIKTEDDIKLQLNKLYSKYKELIKGSYHIIFIWNLENKLMFDVWIHDIENFTDSGPIIECLTFRSFERSYDVGMASGDGLIVLGREEELRRTCNSLDAYINRIVLMPNFPQDFKPYIRF